MKARILLMQHFESDLNFVKKYAGSANDVLYTTLPSDGVITLKVADPKVDAIITGDGYDVDKLEIRKLNSYISDAGLDYRFDNAVSGSDLSEVFYDMDPNILTFRYSIIFPPIKEGRFFGDINKYGSGCERVNDDIFKFINNPDLKDAIDSKDTMMFRKMFPFVRIFTSYIRS